MKARLRRHFPDVRRREESELLPLVDDAPSEQPGRWTAKDEVAHLAVWRELAAAELDAARTGGPAPRRISDDVNVVNQDFYERSRALPAADVIALSRRSWDLLEAALEATPEDVLDRPYHRSSTGQTYWGLVANQMVVHLTGHVGPWHQAHGDDAAFEAVTRWARDVALEAFPELPEAGACVYNLGCCYAVRGRAEEAIPHLRRAIEMRPDLREWAKHDTDLDPIRSHPAVARLLAGEPA